MTSAPAPPETPAAWPGQPALPAVSCRRPSRTGSPGSSTGSGSARRSGPRPPRCWSAWPARSATPLVTHPTEADAGDPPTCLLKYTTGFICPGCGGTRAAWYLLHGDLPAAARHHALFVFAVPFLLYMYVAWAGKRLFGWRLPQLTLSPKVIGIFIAVWGVWSVLRNLPWAPFTSFYV